MQVSTLHEETVADVVSAALDGAGDDVLVVNPTGETISELVTQLDDRPSPPSTRLLAAEAVLKDVVEDFLLGSAIADLAVEDILEVRTLEDVPRNELFVSEETVTVLVDAGRTVAGLSAESSDFVHATTDHYANRWETATEFTLRTPPRTTVTSTLAEDVAENAAADFRALLDSLDAARGNGDGLGEVAISLLVAARNDILLYDISKWGEDVGIASKATFSRTKSRLEEHGLLDTDKVPIDVGRPRLRLKLGEDALADVSVEELADLAADRLAEEA